MNAELREQNKQLQAKIDLLSQDIDYGRGAVSELVGRLEAVQRTAALRGARVDELTAEVQKLAHSQYAKRQTLQHKESRLGRPSSKSCSKLSILESVASNQDGIMKATMEIEGSRRRGKRERASMSNLNGRLSRDVSKTNTKGSSTNIKATLFYSDENSHHNTFQKQGETKMHKRQRMHLKATEITEKKLECKSTDSDSAKYTMISHGRCDTSQETIRIGTDHHNLENVMSPLEASPSCPGDYIQRKKRSSSSQRSLSALGTSSLEEAAEILMKLSTSSPMNHGVHAREVTQLDTLQKESEGSRERRVSKLHRFQDKRRSTRTTAPTQRFSPEDHRKRKKTAEIDRADSVESMASKTSTADRKASSKRTLGNRNLSKADLVKAKNRKPKTADQSANTSTLVKRASTEKNLPIDEMQPPAGARAVPSSMLLNASSSTDSQDSGSVSMRCERHLNISRCIEKIQDVHQSTEIENEKLTIESIPKSLANEVPKPTTETPFHSQIQAAHPTPQPKVIIDDDFFSSEDKPGFIESEGQSEDMNPPAKTGNELKDSVKGKRINEGTNRGLSRRRRCKDSDVERVNDTNKQDFVDLDGWTLQQTACLRFAYEDVDPSSNQFWAEVAARVEGRGEDECRKKWFSLVKSPNSTKKKISKLKHSINVNTNGDPYHEDDLFNSTPMITRSLKKSCFEGKENKILEFDFGSPIVVDRSFKRNIVEDDDDEGLLLEVPRGKHFTKTFIKSLRKEIAKARREKTRQKVRPIHKKGPRVISSAIECGELEMKGTLSPGGTMKVRTLCEDGDSCADLDMLESDDDSNC